MANESNHSTTNNAHPDLSVLQGGVSIVTGGASGIGLALAEKSLQHGLHTVLADIDNSAVDAAVDTLSPKAQACGVQVVGCPTDVSLRTDIDRLADKVRDSFPQAPISLLCCNAGVGAGGGVLSARDVDWQFVLGVNLMGVVHCIQRFVPLMLEQDAPASVMATSSQDGLCAAQGVYGVSKHACVALMEALHGEVSGRVSVHVLCPNAVATNIVTSERHRPEHFGGSGAHEQTAVSSRSNPILERFKKYGMPPSRCAELVFDAMRTGVFYILAEAEDDEGYVRLEAQTRMEAILNGTRPYRPRSALLTKIFSGL